MELEKFCVHLVLLCLSPLILVVTLLGLTVKKFVEFIAYLTNQDVFSPVASEDLMFMCDTFNTKPHSPFLNLFVVNGIPDHSKVIKDLSSVYSLRDENGQRLYWKLSTYPSLFWGYWFWKQVPDFENRIKNQVTYISEEEVKCKFGKNKEHDINQWGEGVLRRPFPEGTPPWDLTVVPNYLDNNEDNEGEGVKSLLIFRFSHGTADGYSCVKLFSRMSGYKSLPGDVPAPPVKEEKKDFNFWLKVTTEGLLDYIKIIENLPERNVWTNAYLGRYSNGKFLSSEDDGKVRLEVQPSGQWMCSLTPKMKIENVKLARKFFGTTFYAVVITGLVGGLRKFIEKYYGEDNVPKKVTAMLPGTKVNHPDDTLCNHWRPMIVGYPMGPSDPNRSLADRMAEMANALDKEIRSTASEFGGLMYKLLSVLPVGLYMDEFTAKFKLSLTSSILSSSPNMHPLLGQEVDEFIAFIPVHREHIAPMAWCCLSSNGNIRVSLTADTAFIPNREMLDELAGFIHQEFLNIFEQTVSILKN